jgi:hypothetical protein
MNYLVVRGVGWVCMQGGKSVEQYGISTLNFDVVSKILQNVSMLSSLSLCPSAASFCPCNFIRPVLSDG